MIPTGRGGRASSRRAHLVFFEARRLLGLRVARRAGVFFADAGLLLLAGLFAARFGDGAGDDFGVAAFGFGDGGGDGFGDAFAFVAGAAFFFGAAPLAFRRYMQSGIATIEMRPKAACE